MQHLFVLLRYSNKLIYAVLELTLEVYFEWTIISEFEHVREMHWVVLQVGATMLVSHWMYLIAALAELFVPSTEENPSRSRRDSAVFIGQGQSSVFSVQFDWINTRLPSLYQSQQRTR